MSTKFFNNSDSNTLFGKLQGIAQEMVGFSRFWAVVGFFRSSGYFRLRRELEGVENIRILVGINMDRLLAEPAQLLPARLSQEEAKQAFGAEYARDVEEAGYSREIETGMRQFYEDVLAGRLELRVHSSKALHAKFYLCLPQHHSANSDGWVIMGSSNISEAGLGLSASRQYELNVAMKDYDDVQYCVSEFERLWAEGVAVTAEDIATCQRNTYLTADTTPYKLYMKVLIDYFGDRVEDDYGLTMPKGLLELQYQTDAAVQGYQLLVRHNGFFLADVVGLGKTIVAAMIAKRYVEVNGRRTKILVVHPPAVRENWRKTFADFGLDEFTQQVTVGSLGKVLDGVEGYWDAGAIDLVIVDEAHAFRNSNSVRFGELQRICKYPCTELGRLQSLRKRVMLLSATPLNNRPQDLYHQLLLFQDAKHCTIDGITELDKFFKPYIRAYKDLMQERKQRMAVTQIAAPQAGSAGKQANSPAAGQQEPATHANSSRIVDTTDKIYQGIRTGILDKVTIRRTRSNITNDAAYRADLARNGVLFPIVSAPCAWRYTLGPELRELFYTTLSMIDSTSDGPHLNYARYQAIRFLLPEYGEKYRNAEATSEQLATIYHTLLMKRLESSFVAFLSSLRSLLTITEEMIDMFDNDKVIIAPGMDVKMLFAQGYTLDEIIEKGEAKGLDAEEFVYPADAFEADYLDNLLADRDLLRDLIAAWEGVKEDPKLELFEEKLRTELFDKERNPSGKLVIFSESIVTSEYLAAALKADLQREDVLMVSSVNRAQYEETIRANFDANYDRATAPQEAPTYNILITTDVLAEGINLHRANVIVNYDSPWNAARLMQRVGRVNRIGTTNKAIYHYLFYPSAEGEQELGLYSNALIKLQGFHSALGEDGQVYSTEEIVREFQLYDSSVRDDVDRQTELLREVQDLYAKDRDLYNAIKGLSPKSRVMRSGGAQAGKTVVYLSSPAKNEFYLVEGQAAHAIGFLEAVEYFRAGRDERPQPEPQGTQHHEHVQLACALFEQQHSSGSSGEGVAPQDTDPRYRMARNFIKEIGLISTDPAWRSTLSDLREVLEAGIYTQLVEQLLRLQREMKKRDGDGADSTKWLREAIEQLHAHYGHNASSATPEVATDGPPRIILSETFI